MFILNIVFHFIALCFLSSYHSLEQLPKDKAPTDEIREVVNQIFSNLKLKRKQDSKLSEYSTIHKHFIGLTQLENDNWKILTKLTRIDSRIDNGTTDLTTIINDILNEENNTVESNGPPNDDDVNEYIENFLTTLARFKETYLVNDSYSTINTDVLEHFYRNGISEDNKHNNRVDAFNSSANNNSIDELEFWSPTETRRIFRGTKTKIKHFPFLASVHIFNQFTCAGSLIHTDLVITAASCLQLAYNNRFFRENPAFLAVRVGSPFFNAGGERISVLEVYFHPSYTPRTLKNNIAIMRLEKMIKFRKGKRNVRKIEIDRNNWNLAVNTKGVTIVGWGARSPSNKIPDPWSSKLSMAHLPIYPFEDCQDVYSKEYVTRKNFCAGFMSKGGGACNRDVGAPAVIHGILTGIASFGAPHCGTVDAPTVFTKVGHYYDWIETIMEQDVPHIKVKTTLRPYFVAQNYIPIVIKDDKDFKISPLAADGIKDVIDSKNANRLRMDQNNHFENFLGTMFNGKDQEVHKVELSHVERLQTKQNKETEAKDEKDKEASKIYEKLLTTRVDTDEDNFSPVKFVTTMGNFESEPVTSRESDIDAGVNPTELEKNVQTDVVDDNIVLEATGKTTPILEEYGLSIELSHNPTVKNQQDYDSERKHQKNKSDDPEKYMNDNTMLNQDSKHEVQEVNESTNDVNDETINDDSQGNAKSKHKANELAKSLRDVGDTYKFNEKSEEQLKDLEEYINEENESTQLFNNEMIQQVEVPEESKTNFNAQPLSAKQIQSGRPDALVKDVGSNDSFSKKRLRQLNKQFNKHAKLQTEMPDESLKYKDVITELNKERQHQLEESELSIDQEDEKDKLTNNTNQLNVQFNEQQQRQVKEPNEHVEESEVSENAHFNTQTNKPHHSQPVQLVQSVAGIDHNLIKKERNKEIKNQATRVSNHKHETRWQHPEKKKVMKKSKYQEGVQLFSGEFSGEVLKGNTEFNQFSQNQVTKQDESLWANYDASFENKREQQTNAHESFERNARPKFDAKLIEKTEKPMHDIDGKENKHQVEESEISLRHEGVQNQFSKNRENSIQTEGQYKNENFDKKLDEQIDKLLKNLDVENRIRPEMIDRINDKKVIKDTKLLELMENKQDEKQELDGDALLTFLLLTDNGRNRSEIIKQNESSNDDIESNGKEGFKIDGDYYEELTFRTNNVTDDSYKIMSENEMYDILADAILPEEAVVV
ncbi:hypothetical protein MSG28_013898 [Choristoneura fumiferana]|uniref:Uncharacterized protein n=1 Tax=Choristoneura fumiferana TaxID=7141 RepID=A0ACC0K9H7_CHOFU|nr:hypothetical protein MSG28_013898 [Choristoneura fumiferana]